MHLHPPIHPFCVYVVRQGGNLTLGHQYSYRKEERWRYGCGVLLGKWEPPISSPHIHKFQFMRWDELYWPANGNRLLVYSFPYFSPIRGWWDLFMGRTWVRVRSHIWWKCGEILLDGPVGRVDIRWDDGFLAHLDFVVLEVVDFQGRKDSGKDVPRGAHGRPSQ